MKEVASDLSYLTTTVHKSLFFLDGLTTIPIMKRLLHLTPTGNDSDNPIDRRMVGQISDDFSSPISVIVSTVACLPGTLNP